MTTIHRADHSTAPPASPDGTLDRARLCELEARVAELEAEGRARAAHLDAILDCIPSGVTLCDAAGHVVHMNAAAERILQLSAEDKADTLDGRVSRMVLRTEDGQPLAASDTPNGRALRGQAVQGTWLRYGRPDEPASECRWLLTSAAPLLDLSGTIAGTVACFADGTEQRRAEQALHDNERRYRTFFENLREAVTIMEPVRDGSRRIVDWVVRDANAVALGLVRRARDGVVARPISGLFGPDAVAHLNDRYRAVLETGEPSVHEAVFGDRCFLISSFRLGPNTVASAAVDLTERKRAEQILRDVDRRKSEFLAVLSHELRNPLTPVRNSLYILERAIPGGVQAGKAIATISRQVDQLGRLVDDLLDVTRLDRGKLRIDRDRFDLVETARRATDDQRPMFDAAELAFDVRLPEACVLLDGDQARITQVIDNLLNNAVKFTSAGGAVSFALEVDARSREAVLRVRDTGVGIGPELLAELFEPFVQADRTLDRSKGGLGLGLALVKGVVELHAGRVEARSDGYGKGAEMIVRLPIQADRPIAADKPSSDHPPPLRILIVEDNVDAADTLRDVLELGGHAVEVAYSGSDALARAKSFHAHVVLCDIGLPGMDGYEVARLLCADESLRSTHLVALSGYAADEDQERARAAGFHEHIAKPSSLEQIEQVLSRVASGIAR